MGHDCRSALCDTPHYEDDRHEHDWLGWTGYPECGGCLRQLAQWIHENTDFKGCPIPEHCDYRPACDEQYQIEVYGKVVRPSRKEVA